MNEIAVVGAGAWGCALALQAARAGGAVRLWARRPEIFADRVSPHLPGVRLPEAVRIESALPGAALILLVVPLQHLRRIAAALPPGGKLVCCAKGVETGTGKLALEILAEAAPGRAAAVLSGPNFAHEIAAGQPAATVIAGPADLREQAAAALATPAFRVYGNDDPIGVQVGGAAKNVVAIAAGAAIGAGLGENARAAIVTRGLAELARLAVALGGRAETVAGLSGLGDLILTCAGAASRNFSLGVALGRGEALARVLAGRQAMAEGAVTEGVTTAPALLGRARALGVDLPVCAAVAGLVEGRFGLGAAMESLLSRPRKDE